MFPGYFRMFPQSKIIPVEYDCETGTSHRHKINIPIDFVEQYRLTHETIPEETKHMMYMFLQNHRDLKFIFVINQMYLGYLIKDSFFVYDLIKEENYGMYRSPAYEVPTTVLPVGFEVTKLGVTSVLTTPARVYFDKDTKTLHGTEWEIPNVINAMVEYKKKDIYKDMIKAGENIVVMTKDGRRYF